MARGYSGAFGHKLNAPYVFLPLCAIFLLGLLDWRRPWRVANLDLLVLLGFAVSHFFFNRAQIGVSVPLVYPLLLYLFGRALWIGVRGRGEGLRPVWPATWLLVAALFLVGFRVGLNLADSGAIDVGYAERRRRRPHHPRRTALRQLPRGRLAGRHLRPGQLLRLRPQRGGLALVGVLGRPARRPRRRGPLRPRHLRACSSCSAAASAPARPAARSPRPSPSAGPPSPTPPTCSSRTPTTPWSRCSWSRRSWSSPVPLPAARWRSLATLTKFAPRSSPRCSRPTHRSAGGTDDGGSRTARPAAPPDHP